MLDHEIKQQTQCMLIKTFMDFNMFALKLDQHVLRRYYHNILEGFQQHREHGPRSMGLRSVVPPDPWASDPWAPDPWSSRSMGPRSIHSFHIIRFFLNFISFHSFIHSFIHSCNSFIQIIHLFHIISFHFISFIHRFIHRFIWTQAV